MRRRQDHALEPLLRRLIRRIPEPVSGPAARIQVVDLEVTEGLKDITSVDADVARVLVRAHGAPLGFVDLSCRSGGVSATDLRHAISQEFGDDPSATNPDTPVDDPVVDSDAPWISIVVPTRNRSQQLARCIESLRDIDYPRFEILIVDNAPSDDATRLLVEAIADADPRVRYLREPIPGASRARNRGTEQGRGDIVAFTDDDVQVDRLWLRAIAAGFREPSVGMVGGLTIPSSLETPAQHAFESYGGMARGFRRRVYDVRENRGDTLLYPYTPGIFGASNNAAFRRVDFLRRGGFDLALGPATPAYSAEDLDAFLALILSGEQIVYEPRAIVRHEHRRDFTDLYWQVFTYSAGSSALLAKWSLSRWSVAKELARRLPGLIPAALLKPHRSGAEAGVGHYPTQLRWLERAGYLYGPIAYWRSRRWSSRRGARASG